MNLTTRSRCPGCSSQVMVVRAQSGCASVVVLFGVQRRRHRRGHPGIVPTGRHVLVGDELGLQDQPGLVVDRLDLVRDRRDRALGERDQPGRTDPDDLAGGRAPFDGAGERARAQVEHPLVLTQLTVAGVERLVVDQQPHHLAVGDVDDRLPRLGVAVTGLRVR
jgi:hypothetical protein